MSDLFGKLKSGANKVAFEADKMNRSNKAQGELDKLKGQITANYAKLGEMVYRQYTNQEAVSPALVDLCKSVADLEKQVGMKGDEIARIKAEVFGAPAAAPTQPAPAAAPAMQAPTPAPAAAAAPVMAAPVSAPEASAAPGPKHCTNCGSEIPPGVKFCPDCGTKVA